MAEASMVYVVDPNTSPKRVTLRRQAVTVTKNTKTTFPEIGKDLLLITDLESGNFSISNFILKPIIISPINNSEGFIGNVTIRPYTPSPTFKGTFTKVIIELAADRNFTNIIARVDSDTDISTAVLKPTISKSTVYLRARHVSGEHLSDWSNITAVKVAQLEYIDKPTIILPTTGTTGALIKHLYIKSTPFTIIGALDSAQEYTEYQVAKDPEFNNIVSREYVRLNMQDIIINNIVFDYGTEYYIRIRYKGTKYGTSEWSDTVKIRTQDSRVDLGVDGNNEKLSGNDLDGAFYGEIDFSRLIAPNYRGNWKSVLTYTVDSIVVYNNKKYIAILENKNQTPTNTTFWEPYLDNGIPTAKWLLNSVGIGYGLTDNNIDGLSNGRPQVGNIVNDDTSWLKFVYDERVLYITKKPIVDNISWNDIAKRYLTDNKRTVRVNNRLYYVKLLTQEEYENTLVALTNGTLGTENSSSLELDKQIWISDSSFGPVKKTISSYSDVTNVDSMSRTISYRPVLELINIGDEPFNNLPTDIPLAENENFIMDVETDTGYFGVVKSENLINGDSLASLIGLGNGESQNSNSDWFKFYYHGYILYTPLKPLRHSILREDLLNINALYGVDLGSKANAKCNINNKEYFVGVLSGANKVPSEMIVNSGDPTSTTNFLTNVRKEIGKGSMWNDLIYRVHGVFVDDVLANQDTLNYVELHGGVQIGDNFDNFSTSDLGIATGNGSNTICQEVSSANPLETITRGYYFLPGIVRQGFNQRLSIFGWRPILIVK